MIGLIVWAGAALLGSAASKFATTAATIGVPVGREFTRRELERDQRLAFNMVLDRMDARNDAVDEKMMQLCAGRPGAVVELTEDEEKKAVEGAGRAWWMKDLPPEVVPEHLVDRYTGKWVLTEQQAMLLRTDIHIVNLENGHGQRAAWLREVAERAGVDYGDLVNCVVPPTWRVQMRTLRDLSEAYQQDDRVMAEVTASLGVPKAA